MGRASLVAFAGAVAVTTAFGCSSTRTVPAIESDGGSDASVDTTVPVCGLTSATQLANGIACGCDTDCESGHCVDGLCCDTACTDTCKACNVQSSPGICSFVPSGLTPRSPAICPASDSSSCGLDGTCDGAGGCRKYPLGTTCQAGQCDGASVTNVEVCDGQGHCRPGATTICAPYNCDATTGSCARDCRTNNDCATGVQCVNGSCGLKPRGAVCANSAECASGFCADGYCCNVACSGPCIACNQVGREGTCWPIDVGRSDPHQMCKRADMSSCGMTGTCDGTGGCALYAAETVCAAATCNADQMSPAATCDGAGSCRVPAAQSCAPFQCSAASSACLNRCNSNADCASGHTCVNGSCGPKSLGQSCSGNSECASSFCVDGVCCDGACEGACRSCALASSLGHCTPVATGAADPRRSCVDQHAQSCQTDGLCDGAGACRKYKAGTVCAPETCANNVHTPAATCDGAGTCVKPSSVPCAPYACNGGDCYDACTVDINCSPGNVCLQNSCGKKPNGAPCSAANECASATCAQGVCCSTSCAGACKSCALSGSLGTCMNVPTGQPDPAQTCKDQGAASCGTNGRCAAGACQVYPAGTTCAGATCPAGGSTLISASSCDGAGTCVSGAVHACYPYQCGTAAACRTICTTDAECAPPAVCQNGSCGLKPPGASCTDGSECSSKFCAQGVCCATACAGTCNSCALSGKLGTCSPVPAGARDPSNTCKDQGAPSCGMTGFCDGTGGCQVYAAGTVCVGELCAGGASVKTISLCNGKGMCVAGSSSCGLYVCDPAKNSCRTDCNGDGMCGGSAICVAGVCLTVAPSDAGTTGG